MSEYFLADIKAEERAKQREASHSPKAQPQGLKATQLGDFLLATVGPTGCDPYNSTQGKVVQEVWTNRRARR
jgi:hypothetical protein